MTSHTPKRRGQFQMIVMDRTIVTIGRKWRSKWWEITCAGCKGRRRKDGTCKHERLVLTSVDQSIAGRVRIAKAEAPNA